MNCCKRDARDDCSGWYAHELRDGKLTLDHINALNDMINMKLKSPRLARVQSKIFIANAN